MPFIYVAFVAVYFVVDLFIKIGGSGLFSLLSFIVVNVNVIFVVDVTGVFVAVGYLMMMTMASHTDSDADFFIILSHDGRMTDPLLDSVIGYNYSKLFLL